MAAVQAEPDALADAAPARPELEVAAAHEPVGAPPAAERPRPRKKRSEDSWWRRPLRALGPLPVALGAAVLLALGIGIGTLVSSGSSDRTVQAQVVAPSAPSARASLTIGGDDQATLKVQNFPSPPRGRVYQVWLKRPGSAAPQPTDALFDVRNGTATVDVPGGVQGVDQVLVTDEPNGGSAAPTRSPVVVAQSA